ncbi:ThuA domain-containing protein [Streptomyces sp. NPDC001315]|uniref:ThuA domain-containing protein n=1 Tax=Streptomyces sp. NPDC001315 TaxID=3364562 RepID=UPI0036BDD1DB
MHTPPAAPANVVVFNENHHESTRPEIRAHYPRGIHGTLAAALTRHLDPAVLTVRTTTQDAPDHPEVLLTADVLVWWGHLRHDDVDDALVEHLRERVLGGMGLVVLHSGAGSRLFRALLGTTCAVRWRHGDDRQLVWTVKPGHPIAAGVPQPLVIDGDEMYGEPFDIPEPDELVFISSFTGGEVFRSGACFTRGAGRVFYFSPGDQEAPVYEQEGVQRVIANAVRWAAPTTPVGPAPANAQSPVGWWRA